MISHIEFLAMAGEYQSEASAIVAECPAEESQFSPGECVEMARQLIGNENLPLQFAVFVAIMDRFGPMDMLDQQC